MRTEREGGWRYKEVKQTTLIRCLIYPITVSFFLSLIISSKSVDELLLDCAGK